MKKIIKKINKILQNKFIGVFLIAIFAVFWWSASLYLIKTPNFAIINVPYSFKNHQTTPLMKEDIVKGEFTSKENNLGIIYITFNDFIKVNFNDEDILEFRIKEKGSTKWYSVSNYRTGVIKGLLDFPFGIQPIENAKGKTFVFEIKSLSGNKNNAISISKNKSLVAGYHYSHAEIFGNKKNLINYLLRKTYYSFQSSEFIFASLICALPLFVYLIYLGFSYNATRSKKLLVVLFPLLLISDILFVNKFYNGILVLLIIIWLTLLATLKGRSKINFSISFLLIIIWTIFNLFKIDSFTNKLSIWTFFFFAVGVLLLIYETKRNE